MQEILKNVQINIPFHFLHDRYLPTVIKERINPEISFNYVAFDKFSIKDFKSVARSLLEEDLKITFHAPFMDLRPGAIDPSIRKATKERIKQVFDLAYFFKPVSVVCHPSFDKRYYISNENIWLENSVNTWEYFSQIADETGTIIALENVYESDPHNLRLLFDALSSPNICFCFDTGHFNVFSSVSLDDWISSLGSRIGQLHIHDNNGMLDEHLPAGNGTFPFSQLFAMIRKLNVNPIVTLEPHSEKHLFQSLENIKKMNLIF